MSTNCTLALAMLALATSAAARAETEWATSAHHFLIDSAFRNEDLICKNQMKAGSDFVDRLADQFKPRTASRHAMRDPDQSVEQAKAEMEAFIAEHYAAARVAQRSGDLDTACFERGQALHPVMDSTSPAHEGFQVWDPLGHPGGVFHHGDFPGSVESLKALLSDPDRAQRTILLMIAADLKGMGP